MEDTGFLRGGGARSELRKMNPDMAHRKYGERESKPLCKLLLSKWLAVSVTVAKMDRSCGAAYNSGRDSDTLYQSPGSLI